jgi:serine/threonine-protein kinase
MALPEPPKPLDAASPSTLPDRTSLVETLPRGEREERPRAPVPCFEDEGEIGRGGMGAVHVAHDEKLLRRVAMKRIHRSFGDQPRRLANFVEEAQIQAQLEHPHIVPVHALGVDAEGLPFFTMKLVNGSSLYNWLKHPARPVGSAERLHEGLEIFLRVCDAIAFAHARGVIHRDLKPENVMVGDFGAVYVMDWGLALPLREAGVKLSVPPPGASVDGPGPVGTPSYMAPEAARGLIGDCDERTDVFGLGALLYEIVTDRAPYPDGPVDQILELAKRGAIRPPEAALGGAGVSKKLLRIVKKALDPDRQKRHASVVHLKQDVQAFLRGGLYLPRKGFPAGARVVVEGDVGDAAYIIVRGTCEAYKTIATHDGMERRVLRTMGPGDVFGEMAVLSDVPRTATVEALEDVTALVITRAALEEGIGLDSWVGTLVKALARRFRELDEKLHGP